MRIWLCGQKFFGQEVLRLLRGMGHEIVGVSAPREHPDGKADRLYKFAALDGLTVLDAGRLNADTVPAGVDLIVAAHSHDFISRQTRLRTKLGAIGYHPSLLPLHRGRDAVRWAVKMGDRVTGGTVYWLDDNVDAGPIAAQEFCFIRPDDDAQSLWRRELQPMGLRLIERALRDIDAGRLVRAHQDEALATWEPSWGRPPVYRPDLLQIGAAWGGYRVLSGLSDAETVAAY